MDPETLSPRRLLRAAGYVAFGTLGTAIGSIGAIAVLSPLQPAVYGVLYRRVGPWTATTAATVVLFTLAGAIAIAMPVLTGVYLRTGRAHLRALLVGLGGLLAGLLLLLGVASLAGVAGFLTAVVAFGLVVVAVPVGLRRLGGWAGGAPVFAGGLPVLVLLLLALGFGLGWGGGYQLVAEPVDPPNDGTPVADFDAVPTVRDDLFGPAGCAGYGDDGVCRLPLRGYEHEARAARFLDRHGVRCPFLNADDPREPGSFLAEHDGTVYRVTCIAFGD